jgi:hypothetical protein
MSYKSHSFFIFSNERERNSMKQQQRPFPRGGSGSNRLACLSTPVSDAFTRTVMNNLAEVLKRYNWEWKTAASISFRNQATCDAGSGRVRVYLENATAMNYTKFSDAVRGLLKGCTCSVLGGMPGSVDPTEEIKYVEVIPDDATFRRLLQRESQDGNNADNDYYDAATVIKHAKPKNRQSCCSSGCLCWTIGAVVFAWGIYSAVMLATSSSSFS